MFWIQAASLIIAKLQKLHKSLPWLSVLCNYTLNCNTPSSGTGGTTLYLHSGFYHRPHSSFLSLADLHPLRKMLHLQLGIRRQPSADNTERRNGERLGDHAGYPAGRVPPGLGRNRSAQSSNLTSFLFSHGSSMVFSLCMSFQKLHFSLFASLIIW